MIIGGKCSLNNEQIIDRFEKGATALEFHTEPQDFINSKKHLSLKQVLKETNITCYAIHSPMKNFMKSNCCLTAKDSEAKLENMMLFKKTIDLASELCDYKNPVIVIHPCDWIDFEKEHYESNIITEQNKRLEEQLYSLNEYVHENYPHINLALENTTPFSIKNNKMYLYIDDIMPDYAAYINSLKLSNVKFTLDICHAESACRFNNIINPYNPINIFNYIDAYKNNLALIHLNNLIDLGEITSKHSTGYDINNKNDIIYLTNVLDYLNKINYSELITIEVLEDDYLNALNYEKTIKSINQIMKYYK